MENKKGITVVVVVVVCIIWVGIVHAVGVPQNECVNTPMFKYAYPVPELSHNPYGFTSHIYQNYTAFSELWNHVGRPTLYYGTISNEFNMYFNDGTADATFTCGVYNN